MNARRGKEDMPRPVNVSHQLFCRDVLFCRVTVCTAAVKRNYLQTGLVLPKSGKCTSFES
jgi:hypothetical protein